MADSIKVDPRKRWVYPDEREWLDSIEQDGIPTDSATKGEPFAVVLSTGGPHTEITGGGSQRWLRPYRVLGRRGGSDRTRSRHRLHRRVFSADIHEDAE